MLLVVEPGGTTSVRELAAVGENTVARNTLPEGGRPLNRRLQLDLKSNLEVIRPHFEEIQRNPLCLLPAASTLPSM